MLEKLIKSRYIKDNFAMMAGTLIGGFLGYAFHFFISRRLSVADYGEIQGLLSVFMIFGVFNSTLSYFTVKHTSVFASHNDREANWEFVRYLIPRVVKYAALFFVALLIFSSVFSSALHFSNPIGFVAVSTATFVSAIAVVYTEILRGWRKFVAVSVAGVLTALAKFVSGAVLALLSHKTSIVILSVPISSFAAWYLTRYWSKKKISLRNKKKEVTGWKDKYFSEINIRKSAVNIFFFSLVLVLVSNLDMVLVKYFSSPETAGYYGAFSLLGKIVLWLNLSVVSVVLPGACADGHEGRRPVKRDLLKSYGLMSAIGIGVAIVFFLFPDIIIQIFFGKKYIFDAQILWLFGVMSFLLSILTLEANLSFAKRDFRVVYFLAMTAIAMIAGAAKYHDSLRQIVFVFTASFLFGYVFITLLNLAQERKRIRPETA